MALAIAPEPDEWAPDTERWDFPKMIVRVLNEFRHDTLRFIQLYIWAKYAGNPKEITTKSVLDDIIADEVLPGFLLADPEEMAKFKDKVNRTLRDHTGSNLNRVIQFRKPITGPDGSQTVDFNEDLSWAAPGWGLVRTKTGTKSVANKSRYRMIFPSGLYTLEDFKKDLTSVWPTGWVQKEKEIRKAAWEAVNGPRNTTKVEHPTQPPAEAPAAPPVEESTPVETPDLGEQVTRLLNDWVANAPVVYRDEEPAPAWVVKDPEPGAVLPEGSVLLISPDGREGLWRPTKRKVQVIYD